MPALPWWQRALMAVGGVKVAVGLACACALPFFGTPRDTARFLLALAHVLVYGGAAWILIAGGARDRRAVLLGLIFLLTSSVFADTLLYSWIRAEAPLGAISRVLFAVQVDAFTPYFLWRFVGLFPRGPDFGWRYHAVRVAARAAVIVGSVLMLLNLLRIRETAEVFPPALAQVAASFSRVASGGGYWPLVFGLSLPALAMPWTGLSKVSRDERRRVALLGLGLVVCAAPTLAWVFAAEMWPSFMVAVPLSVAGFLIYPLLLMMPVWTTYVVRVHSALDVRMVARNAVRYALARQTVLLLAILPFAIVALEVYKRRSLSISALLGGQVAVSLGALMMLGFAAVRGRRYTLDWLDRRYFREQFDARQILTDLVERCRRARSHIELADALRSELMRALHPESTHLLVLDEKAVLLVSPESDIQPIEAGRPLLRLAESHEGAFDTDLELRDSSLAALPEVDRAWLADSGAKLGVPLKGADGTLVGLLLLGEKKSELPYSNEDRRWLTAVASATAMALVTQRAETLRRSGDPEAAKELPVLAVECARCGSVYPPTRSQCESCLGNLGAIDLPLVVAGKFRLLKRLGEGAMGVVYRGIDVQLSRAVAIKTLPRLNAAAASRLRREARVLASVSHPSLASIYGAESWRGMPMLVLELLPGGTMADRIARGPVPSAEVLQFGMSLADALEAVHKAGILHRDVKPSNIGFTSDGVPKLLDFGVSRLLGRAVSENPGDSADRPDVRAAVTEAQDDLRMTTTAEGRVVGTPLYLSPEALDAERPEPSFDVWSLCMVLYEAIAGQHPLNAPSVSEVMTRISRCDVPDIRRFLPGADEAVAVFFRGAFSPDRTERPRRAAQLRQQLEVLRRL